MDIFTEIIEETKLTNHRILSLHQRVEKILDNIENGDTNSENRCYDPTPVAILGIFKNKSLPPKLQDIYNKCHDPPAFHFIDAYCSDNVSCLSKYTNPGYFVEQWIEEEKRKQQKFLEEKKVKDEKSTIRKSMPNADNTTTKIKEKLGKIKTWKDLYGTGEGIEFRGGKLSTSVQKTENDLVEVKDETTETKGSTEETKSSEIHETSPCSINPETVDLPTCDVTAVEDTTVLNEDENLIMERPPTPPPPPPPPMIMETFDISKETDNMTSLQPQDFETRIGRNIAAENDGQSPRETKECKREQKASFLEEIKAKQKLRHVEIPQRSEKRRSSAVQLHFTGPIAEILERRIYIASDNDNDDTSDNDEWES